MRILVTANPMHGHVNTVLPLAKAARRAGHDVVLATGPDLASHAERHGMVVWPVGPTHAEAGGRAGLSVDYFTYAAEKRAVELVPRAQGWRPDLVVHEDTELAGPIAAAVTGAGSVVHGLMYPVRIFDALAVTVDRLGDRWGAPSVAAAVRESVYLELAPPALRLPGERIWRDARPLRPRPGPPAGEELPAAVASLPYRRTVHLTLGTVFHESDVLATALGGLRTLPANLVVTAGPGVDPARFGPQPPHVLIAPYLPYLPHTLLLPRCDLVVSHGGAGIMFGALAHGLPQLVLPQGGDQFLNADTCRSSGAALTLAPGEVTASAVAEAVSRLLAEPGFAAAAAAVRAEIADMPDADAVLRDLID